MAQQVLVQLVDDLDGTSSGDISSVQFALDGVSYEIDLNAENAERLREIYADYVTAARRTGGRLKPGSRPVGTGSGDATKIREWAADNGYELAARGRIPSHVVEAFKEASTKRPAKRRSAKKK